MKKLTLLTAMAASICVLTAFKPDKRASLTMKSAVLNVDYKLDDTIRRTTFNEWTSRWDRRSKSYMTNSKLNYFNMPLENITQFMRENPGGSRFYIGLDSTAAGFTPHLILTATDANGNLLTGSQFHLYNVTTVCPPSCER